MRYFKRKLQFSPNILSIVATDVLLIHKKYPLSKENYKAKSLLSHMCKAFEKLLYKQIETFMSNKLSTKFFGFRKNYNTQYSLTLYARKWKNTLGKGKNVSAVLMDLSKSFGTIDHD